MHQCAHQSLAQCHTVTAPATSEEARPVAAEAPAEVEVAMEEPDAVMPGPGKWGQRPGVGPQSQPPVAPAKPARAMEETCSGASGAACGGDAGSGYRL